MLCCARNDPRASPTELGCRTASRSTGGPHPINNVPLRCHVIYSNTFRCDTPGGLPRDTDLPFLKTCYQKLETQKFRFPRYFGRFFFWRIVQFSCFRESRRVEGENFGSRLAFALAVFKVFEVFEVFQYHGAAELEAQRRKKKWKKKKWQNVATAIRNLNRNIVALVQNCPSKWSFFWGVVM